MIISKIDLKKAINKCLDDICIIRNVDKFEINDELYWKISQENILCSSGLPKDLDVGNFQEEWSEIQRDIENGEVLSSPNLENIGYLLVWIASK